MGDISLETHAEHYTYFPGTLIEQMPILIAQGMTPISAADLMRQRIWALSQPTEVKILWWNNHFHLGDAVLYHPDGKIKIELDSQLLRQLNAQSKLQDGQLGIDSETYLSSRGKEFDGKEISPLGLPLSKTSILAHPLWNYLAREKELLEEYTTAVFEETQQFKYESNMGVYINFTQGQMPLAVALCMSELAGRSILYNSVLDHNKVRLIGTASGRTSKT
ncbi:MAG: hypothetical protein AABX47_06975 [Nanoarchaeota archaeon]